VIRGDLERTDNLKRVKERKGVRERELKGQFPKKQELTNILRPMALGMK